MGDRVRMQCFSGDDFGAIVYCHWAGAAAPEIVKAMAERMKNRPGDLDYATARLAQAAMGNDSYDTGYGITNATHLLTADDSHGDAGVILIDVQNNFRVQCLGGYLKSKDGQFVEVDC